VADEAGADRLPGDLAGRAPVDGDVEGSRERLCTDRLPGATTSARAVIECGAMKDTTKPSTPYYHGPPLARL
jgi:hypothetical protein